MDEDTTTTGDLKAPLMKEDIANDEEPAEDTTIATTDTSATVTFDVGGKIYKIARSTLNRYPDTVLARMATKEWDEEQGCGANSSDALFIDRDGDMFRHVLNYMRDGEVHLPVSDSRDAFKKELVYYGFDDTLLEGIHQGNIREAAKLIASVAGNLGNELRDLDTRIEQSKELTRELQQRTVLLQLAYNLFMKVGDNEPDESGIIAVRSTNQDAINVGGLFKEKGSAPILNEYLDRYGLELSSVKLEFSFAASMSKYCDFYLKSTHKVTGTIIKRKVTAEKLFDDELTPAKNSRWARLLITFGL